MEFIGSPISVYKIYKVVASFKDSFAPAFVLSIIKFFAVIVYKWNLKCFYMVDLIYFNLPIAYQ